MQLRNEVMNRRSSRGQWMSDIELQLIEGVGKAIKHHLTFNFLCTKPRPPEDPLPSM